MTEEEKNKNLVKKKNKKLSVTKSARIDNSEKSVR